jgi:hypothetical protein
MCIERASASEAHLVLDWNWPFGQPEGSGPKWDSSAVPPPELAEVEEPEVDEGGW